MINGPNLWSAGEKLPNKWVAWRDIGAKNKGEEKSSNYSKHLSGAQIELNKDQRDV